MNPNRTPQGDAWLLTLLYAQSDSWIREHVGYAMLDQILEQFAMGSVMAGYSGGVA